MSTERIAELAKKYTDSEEFQRARMRFIQEQKKRVQGAHLTENELSAYAERLAWDVLLQLCTESHNKQGKLEVKEILLYVIENPKNTDLHTAIEKVNRFITGVDENGDAHVAKRFTRGNGFDGRKRKFE